MLIGVETPFGLATSVGKSLQFAIHTAPTISASARQADRKAFAVVIVVSSSLKTLLKRQGRPRVAIISRLRMGRNCPSFKRTMDRPLRCMVLSSVVTHLPSDKARDIDARADTKLSKHIFCMMPGRVLTDAHCVGDLPIGSPRDKERADFDLAICQLEPRLQTGDAPARKSMFRLGGRHHDTGGG